MQNKIKDLLKDAMKAGDEVGKLTYRGLISAFMNELVAKGSKPQEELSDEEVMAVIRREIKKREDSINQYTIAGRDELSETEIKEKNLLMKFLPTQMAAPEVEKRVAEILESQKPLDKNMMGKYIGMCVKELKDVASGDTIKTAVEKLF